MFCTLLKNNSEIEKNINVEGKRQYLPASTRANFP
jgi:hypothetical protein